MYSTQSISQKKCDMSTEIDDMDYVWIWDGQLHLPWFIFLISFLEYGNNSYITFNVD